MTKMSSPLINSKFFRELIMLHTLFCKGSIDEHRIFRKIEKHLNDLQIQSFSITNEFGKNCSFLNPEYVSNILILKRRLGWHPSATGKHNRSGIVEK